MHWTFIQEVYLIPSWCSIREKYYRSMKIKNSKVELTHFIDRPSCDEIFQVSTSDCVRYQHDGLIAPRTRLCFIHLHYAACNSAHIISNAFRTFLTPAHWCHQVSHHFKLPPIPTPDCHIIFNRIEQHWTAPLDRSSNRGRILVKAVSTLWSDTVVAAHF